MPENCGRDDAAKACIVTEDKETMVTDALNAGESLGTWLIDGGEDGWTLGS